MDLTLAIAIWGAATGTVATVGGSIALLRDKPILEASQRVEVSKAGSRSTMRLVLHVVNNGRQPLSVFDAGFATQWDRQTRWFRQHLIPVSRHTASQGPDFPMRLTPGESVTITLDLVGSARIYKPGTTPQGFAMDTHKNVVCALPKISDTLLRELYDELDWSQQNKAS
jgi:hypothetical protein